MNFVKNSIKIETLFFIQNVDLIARFYHHMNCLLMIQHFTIFQLFVDSIKIINFHNMISNHEMRTVEMNCFDEKESKSQ